MAAEAVGRIDQERCIGGLTAGPALILAVQ